MQNILTEGKNCWRIEHARSVRFLVDGSAYYSAFARALASAQRSVFILAWDVHSQIKLVRDGEAMLSSELGQLIKKRLDECPELHVYILTWDFPWVIAHERETSARVRGGWFDHPRLHFEFDDTHPTGACHHQKLVVIDDTVAFAGGMDFALARWDTPEHLAKDHRRVNPDGEQHQPAHDVQMAVEGDIARALGEIARYRWRHKTGQSAGIVEVPATHGRAPSLDAPDLTDVRVAVSRTHPEFGDQREVREVQALHLDAIASARHSIFIENQYLTSPEMVHAIGRRLQEPDGPEVLIILPLKNFGWMEAHTIEVLRARSIHLLRNQFDQHGRLRICYPVSPGLGEGWITVHSKVLIIDDNFLRVGSSNLTRRSMTVDTECDLSIESAGDARISRAIAGFRNRLLGEHVGMSPESVAAALDQHHSLVRLVDDRDGADRSLKRLELEADSDAFIDDAIIDPAEPIYTEVLLKQFAPLEPAGKTWRRVVAILSVVLVLSALAATWKWTALNQWVDAEFLARQGAMLRELPMAPLLVVLVYLLAAVVVFPVIVLIFATAILFGPWLGILYSLSGCLASALFTYGLGWIFGRSTVEKIAGAGFQRLVRRLGDSGILTIATLRLFPIAPFTVVNMVIGASGARVKNYAIGTVLGMIPGVTAISFFQSGIEAAFRRPNAPNLILLGIISAAVGGGLVWLRRHSRKFGDDPRITHSAK